MTISKLYVRIFLMVMTVIIAAQICIAGLFRLIGETAGKKNVEPELSAIAFLLKERIRSRTSSSLDGEFQLFLENLARSLSSDIWLEDNEGNQIASTSLLTRPPFPGNMGDFNEYGLSRERGGPPPIHLIVKADDGKKIFYIKRKGKHFFLEELYFIIGLGIITVIVALVLFPVSKQITEPFKKLTESANAISRGEFDKRVEENFRDEAGELAKAFNIMSGRVLQMINGTKELTANISHHIRSPLTRISVAVELMRDKISAGKKKEAEGMLSSIELEIAEIVQLTEKIIELIRVEIAHKSDEYCGVNLTDIASETADKYKDLVKQKSIHYSVEYSKIPVYINGVYRDICEIFDILFDNAVCYSPENGFINLTICEENNEVRITMTNTAKNLTESMLKSIFDPFKRFAPEKIQGNGLGLAIAERIVQNHEGSIQAESVNDLFSIKILFRKNMSVF